MKQSGPIARRSVLRRGGPLRQRSLKTAARYVERRRLVADLLATRPWCELRLPGCTGRAQCVDERTSRARGGSILDESNLQAACFACNGRKEDEPAEALRLGVAGHSWDRP